ncbi:unnamed protein product, partial [marine sediment metagenome]
TGILTKLDGLDLAGEGASALGGLSNLVGEDGIFQVANIIPPYFLQIIIGIYLIQMVFILTKTLVVIDSGEDKLQTTNKTGKNLRKGITLYFITALFAILALFILTTIVLGNL